MCEVIPARDISERAVRRRSCSVQFGMSAGQLGVEFSLALRVAIERLTVDTASEHEGIARDLVARLDDVDCGMRQFERAGV